MVHHVRQENERQERTVRAQLKIKKRKKYDDGYQEPNRIWEGIVRGINIINIEISIFNKKNKWRTRISKLESHTALFSQY